MDNIINDKDNKIKIYTTRSNRCRKLYNKYKHICKDIDVFGQCKNIKIDKMDIQKLEKYISIIRKKYIKIYNCIKSRNEYKQKCI